MKENFVKVWDVKEFIEKLLNDKVLKVKENYFFSKTSHPIKPSVEIIKINIIDGKNPIVRNLRCFNYEGSWLCSQDFLSSFYNAIHNHFNLQTDLTNKFILKKIPIDLWEIF